MATSLTAGQGVLYMKIGVHAREALDDIIARKLKEIDDEGFALWGYGGSTCHPSTMVQPFASGHAARGEPIRLCMTKMVSKHHAEPVRAEQQSTDGVKWQPIPKGINVLGSRYALAIKHLAKVDFELPLSDMKVALGRSVGTNAAAYIAGRVDKACLEYRKSGGIEVPDTRIAQIDLVADLCEPYAVFLRN